MTYKRKEKIGDATFYLGDCLEILPTLPDNSVDAIVTDPPYGLSSHQGSADRIYTILRKVGLPDLADFNAEAIKGGELASVPLGGPLLARVDGSARKSPDVCVPESTVDFEGGPVFKQEIEQTTESTGGRVADGGLPDEANAQCRQSLGDFVLDIGDLPATAGGDLSSRSMPEFFSGGFAVPISAVFPACDPSLLARGAVIDFGGDVVGLIDNAACDAKRSPLIMALPRTVNALMLRFDLSGRPAELLATSRACERATIGHLGCSQLVRARAATSSLATVAEPHRVRVVCDAADRADSFHITVWLPKQSKINARIPRGGFMGKDWDATLPDPEVWRQALRVLKPGGHLLAFAGTRTQHRMACNIEDAGFEIRDMIAWVYGSGFPKSLDVSKAIHKAAGAEREVVGPNRFSGLNGKANATCYGAASRPCETAPATEAAQQWQGWGTALKPALEPITVARKPLKGTVADNVLTHGTGAINVDGCRVATSDVLPKMSGKAILGGSSDGWDRPWKNDPDSLARRQLADDAAIEKANTLGRWPANLIHDGSDEVVGLFPQSNGQQGAVGPQHGSKPSVNAYGDYGPRDDFQPRCDTGSAARFFYCAKASKKDRDEGLEGFEAVHRANGNKWTDQDYRVARGERPPSAESGPRRNHHPTVKPTDLMRYLVRLVTPPGGTVLDPFMGSGSTGKACTLEGFGLVGIEREPEYYQIAIGRVRAVSAQRGLFT